MLFSGVQYPAGWSLFCWVWSWSEVGWLWLCSIQMSSWSGLRPAVSVVSIANFTTLLLWSFTDRVYSYQIAVLFLSKSCSHDVSIKRFNSNDVHLKSLNTVTIKILLEGQAHNILNIWSPNVRTLIFLRISVQNNKINCFTEALRT